MVQVPNLPASNPFSYKSLTNKMGRNIKNHKKQGSMAYK
jgi:hypothetical protein